MRKPIAIAFAALAIGAVDATASARDVWRDIIPDRWLAPFAVEDLPPLEYPAYFSDLDKARAQAFQGRYKLALLTCNRLADADPVAVALVRAECLAALGRVDEALAVLESPHVADEAGAQVPRARILIDTGRADDAVALLARHLSIHPDSVTGHFELGRAHERRGDLDAARDAYAWFAAPGQRFVEKWRGHVEGPFQNAADVVAIGRGLDRWAVLTGAYADNRRLHDAIFSMFVSAYDVIDRGYWPARVAAAEYLRGHDDDGAAMEELSKAYDRNPRDARLLGLMADIQIDRFDNAAADKAIDALRDVDPDSVPAFLLASRNALRRKSLPEAIASARAALVRQPRNLEALGLLAASHLLSPDAAAADAAFARLDALDPDNATGHCEAGMALLANHETQRAAEQFRIAVDRAPWFAPARTQWGLALLEEGDEPAARAALEAAYRLDPFNVKAVNSLRILDQLAGFKRLETAHFTFVFDAGDELVVTRCIAPYMETAFMEVTRDFAFAPPWKTTVEVFPDTDAFSVRTAGLPGLETYGASLGRVMTVVAPRVGRTLGPYNFARVMRHEFTHTLNLAATEGRCPRWLTEGLAVWQESVPFRFEWVPKAMYDRASTGRLFPIDALRDALIHPEAPQDGEIAYMEGFWIVEHLIETRGRESIPKLLDAFRRGLDESAALESITGKPLAVFQSDFFAWAKAKVANWGYDAKTTVDFSAAMAAGESRIAAKDFAGAVVPLERAMALQPCNPLPHRRLAGVFLALKSPEKAVDHLSAIAHYELNDNRYAKAIAKLSRQTGQTRRAIDFATQAIQVDPYDPSAHELLADVIESTDPAAAADHRAIAAALRSATTRPR